MQSCCLNCFISITWSSAWQQNACYMILWTLCHVNTVWKLPVVCNCLFFNLNVYFTLLIAKEDKIFIELNNFMWLFQGRSEIPALYLTLCGWRSKKLQKSDLIFLSFLKYSGPVVRVYGNHIRHLLKPHFCIHNFLIWNSLGSWRGLMPREGRVYCQYLEFLIWEDLPLPSPCRHFRSGAHPRNLIPPIHLYFYKVTTSTAMLTFWLFSREDFCSKWGN